MKKWVCPVCGYVYEGENPPEKCPQCGVPGAKFKEQAGEKTWAAEHVVGVAKGAPEEILQGLAEYCFARENERIRVLFADCCTLAGLEERTVAYLQDIAANRMGDYKMIAQALGTPGKCESVPACADELRDIMRTLLIRLQAAGEIDPAVSLEYCCTAIFSAVVGGLIGLCFTAECGVKNQLSGNLKEMMHRMLARLWQYDDEIKMLIKS